MSIRPLRRGIGWAAAGVLAATFAFSPAAQAAAGTGSIAGTITDQGNPVGGASIYVFADDGFSFSSSTVTDDAGHYAVTDVPEGSAYLVQVSPPNRPYQYAFSKTDWSAADRISVTTGQTTTVDDSLLPTGTISGRFTDSAGNGVAGAWVDASSYGLPNAGGPTGADGSFSFAAFPGAYTVGFSINGLTQYAHGARTPDQAQTFTVVVGQTTTVNEVKISTGSIAGHVTYADGTPAANVAVDADPTSGYSTSATTDGNGDYRFSDLPVDSYAVSFRLASGATQWAHQKRSQSAADPIAVTADAQTTLDEQLLPTGAVAGRFIAADGSPLAGVSVSVIADLPQGGDYLQTTTDADGHYQVDQVFAGGYRVLFQDYQTNLVQWAYGKTTEQTADVVTVTAGQTTTVDDRRLPTGSVRVTATDSLTGAAIQDFWLQLNDFWGNATNGVAVVDNLAIGTYWLSAGADGYAFADRLTQVTVVAGEQTTVAIKLRPVGKITTRVLDRATGAPVAGICVAAFQPTSFFFPDGCERTDDQGKVTLTLQQPGTYNLFVLPPTGSAYGAQWVGATGGTGSQTLAKSLTVAAGQTVAGPKIKLDRTGVIVGKATSETGQPLQNGSVGIVGPDLGTGTDTRYSTIAPDGTYRVDWLGPYNWPLLFVAKDHAFQWSGGSGNRRQAYLVPVKAGKTTTYDYTLKQGALVTITSATIDGRYVVRNAVTGDPMGVRDSEGLPASVTIRVFGPQNVKIQCYANGTGPVWHGGTSFASATPVGIPATGTKQIAFVAG
ncbi:MAG: hypothetical protein HOU81_02145 [Hamadaea sp.]|uniref:MSCRAMM family protein n=1 Tax=Hamadaea sp. TaxID=2024425 RepID=UPI00184944E2|nr:carboxypeptidase regulatory-like domain-containing protein [Hamadaea sp.]NUR69599.1 hypothetical protein [Hamadaea sp.]NUT20289.1 hypothetical protein [Hamadaea sp.]